jgi:hypothetical protein
MFCKLKNLSPDDNAGMERLKLPIVSTLIGALALVSVVSTVLTIWE